MGVGEEVFLRHRALTAAGVANYPYGRSLFPDCGIFEMDEELGFELGLGVRGRTRVFRW